MGEAISMLVRAREILAAPDAWTKDGWARDADGNEVWATSPDAVCFCARGALVRAADELGGVRPEERIALDALNAAVPQGLGSVMFFNDIQNTVEPVLALFDRAIAALNPSPTPTVAATDDVGGGQ